MNIFSYIQPFTFIYFQKVAVIVTLNQGPNCVSKTGSVQSKGVVVTITTTFKRGDWRLPSYIRRFFCVWNGLQLNGNDSAVKQWRMRLKAWVRVQGLHFEHQDLSFKSIYVGLYYIACMFLRKIEWEAAYCKILNCRLWFQGKIVALNMCGGDN